MKQFARWSIFLGLNLMIPFVLISQQIKVERLALSEIPRGVSMPGKVKMAITWEDSSGVQLLVLSETGSVRNNKFKHEEEDGRDAELFARLYFIQKDSVVLSWKIYDYLSDCSFDLNVTFIQPAIQVTDLNRDGRSEVWIMYKLECRSDVSPFDLKIIMYENGIKHAMRGVSEVTEGFDEKGKKIKSGGTYSFDEAFSKAEVEFRKFAAQLWRKYVTGR